MNIAKRVSACGPTALSESENGAIAVRHPELQEALEQLSAACNRYSDYFGRSLDEQVEVMQALDEVVAAHTQSIVLNREWGTLVHTNSAFESANLGELGEWNRFGSNALRVLKLAEAYSGHLVGQTAKLENDDDAANELREMAEDTSRGISLTSSSFATDVNGLQAYIGVLMSEAQGSVAIEMRRLARLTTILTVVLLVVTVFAAVVTGIATL